VQRRKSNIWSRNQNAPSRDCDAIFRRVASVSRGEMWSTSGSMPLSMRLHPAAYKNNFAREVWHDARLDARLGQISIVATGRRSGTGWHGSLSPRSLEEAWDALW
jgi:hypothetical protein